VCEAVMKKKEERKVKIKSKQKKLVDEYGMKKMFLAYDPY
jgi:hypothetical protein